MPISRADFRGPNDLGVSQALAGDNPNTGFWFAWSAGGIPLTSYIERSIATTVNDSYTLTSTRAIQPDRVSATFALVGAGLVVARLCRNLRRRK